ncbi:MAG: type VI secretion system tip protein VgrG [Polyangiaceae bacterium]|nr:type VI secretion system tip protein VgrG [Polyangiaceae bacterium]
MTLQAHSHISSTAGGAAPGTPYTFACFPFPPGHFRVHAIRGREALSKPYRFHVTVSTTALVGEDLERICVGQRGSLTIRLGDAPRVIPGVIESVRSEGVREREGSAQFTFKLVPTLALLRHQRGSRIFQDVSVDQVVHRVLADHGIPAVWQLTRTYPARPYVTQYEETDLAFIERLLAEAGIFYSFANLAEALETFVAALTSPSDPVNDVAALAAYAANVVLPQEIVVFGDSVSAYAPIGQGGIEGALVSAATALGAPTQFSAGPVTVGIGAPSLSYIQGHGLASNRNEVVTEFVAVRRVRSEAAEYRDFDPARPHVPLVSRDPDLSSVGGLLGEASNIAQDTFGATVSVDGDGVHASGQFGAGAAAEAVMKLLTVRRLETYEHHGAFLFPDWKDANALATQIRSQRSRDRAAAEGKSLCALLTSGHRFKLDEHPISDFNREHVVIAVEHRGRVAQDHEIYSNAFHTVPANVVYPPRRPKRKTVQAVLTATVVGPPGEEIHVDGLGRIRVHFHWDRRGVSATSSCWIRSLQPWAGAGFGHQFIPRVGMEVAVTFEGGDPDKPMVIGSLYNGTHPTPFALPADKTRSGIRTSSVPGGGGSNELSFSDSRAQEQVYLHAQRDFDVVVEHDHAAHIRNDARTRVERDHALEVLHDRREMVRGNVSIEHFGARIDVVQRDLDQRVSGGRTTRIEGAETIDVRGNTTQVYRHDVVQRIAGNHTTVVGRNDAKRSMMLRVEGAGTISTSDGLLLEANGGITLRVGKTTLRLGEDGIELVGATVRTAGESGGLVAGQDGVKLTSAGTYVHLGDKLLIKTEAASVSMGSEVKIDGKKILLNAPDIATEEPPPDRKPPTEIELVDENGKPLAYRRFIVDCADGSQRTGVTDKSGKAAIDLTADGTVFFPELAEIESN